MADDYLAKAQRVADYAERFFMAAGRTKWPTVRETAKACRVAQREVADFCDEGIFGLMSTSYFTVVPEPWGNHFVEICK